MISGVLLISVLLPMQIYAHDLNKLQLKNELFIYVACDLSQLMGLPIFKNNTFDTGKYSDMPSQLFDVEEKKVRRRMKYIQKFINQESVFKS
jgi:hypothetical protein